MEQKLHILQQEYWGSQQMLFAWDKNKIGIL